MQNRFSLIAHFQCLSIFPCRKFDSENAESEAALQRLQKETRFSFTWPETKRDDTILVISDSEDDCFSDEEF